MRLTQNACSLTFVLPLCTQSYTHTNTYIFLVLCHLSHVATFGYSEKIICILIQFSGYEINETKMANTVSLLTIPHAAVTMVQRKYGNINTDVKFLIM